MRNNNDEIKVCMSNGALTYEITIQKFAVNSNTKDWLIEKIKEQIDEIIGSDNNGK